MTIICNRCGLVDDYRTVPAGPHIKAICNGCDRYIKFISKHKKQKIMSQMLYGSFCLTDLVEKAKQGHSAFNRAKNGKIYVNVTQWINDEADQYGNHSSVLLNSSKEKKESEPKFYFGNLKKVEGSQSATPIAQNTVSNELDLDDGLPF